MIVLQKIIDDFYHLLFNDMSKRTSEDLSNVLEVANPNDLADGCDDTELSEGSKEPDS